MTMPRLDVLLAVNGVVILVVALLAGLLLYRKLLAGEDPHDWHLLHAGGTGRGVMLIALSAAIDLPLLPSWLLWTAALAVIFFAWVSTIAMAITGATGEHGFDLRGPFSNRIAHVLYVLGAAAVFPGFTVIGFGLVRALIT